MRPIDADVLYKKTEELEKQAREASRQAITEPTQEKWNNILAERSAFKYDITQMPTIDAVPVKHGEWMPIQKQPYFRKHYSDEVSCSLCHKKGHTAWNYCPNCGAKMDGERKDDE